MEQHPNAAGIDASVDLARTTLGLAVLPSIPTHDWCTVAAAKILAGLGGGSWVAVAVGSCPAPEHRLTPQSLGIAAEGDPERASLGYTSLEHLIATSPMSLGTLGPQGVVTGAARLLPTWSEVPDAPDLAGALAAVAPLEIGVPDAAMLLIVRTEPDSGLGSGRATTPAHIAALFAVLVDRATRAFTTSTGTIHWLTEREREVLRLLTLGRSVRVIAEQLERSPHTIHDHVKSLHRKLDASSRGELVATALGHGRDADAPDLIRPRLEIPEGATLTEIKPTAPQRVDEPG